MKLLINASTVILSTAVLDQVTDADDAALIAADGADGIIVDEDSFARLRELNAAHEVTVYVAQPRAQYAIVTWLRENGFVVGWNRWRALRADADAAVTARNHWAATADHVPALSLHTWKGALV